MQQGTRLTYSIAQAMEALGISRQTLYNQINLGRLRTYNVGRCRMVSHEAIENWIRAREAEPVQRFIFSTYLDSVERRNVVEDAVIWRRRNTVTGNLGLQRTCSRATDGHRVTW